MALLLKGRPVADSIKAEILTQIESLASSGITPCLAVVRMGERPDDIAYERSILKSAAGLGVNVELFSLEATDSQDEIERVINTINCTPSIHGCLLFRPLPKHIDEVALCNALSPSKDVDGIGDISLAGVFMGEDIGFSPATAKACIRTLDYYGIELEGKHVCVVGRSLVIGRPVGMLMLNRNATVTYCHSRTSDVGSLMRASDIVVCAAGRAKMFDAGYFSEGQIVLDVGMNVDESGNLCGDVDTESVSQIVEAITPVPGGIGSVTTATLLSHVVASATREHTTRFGDQNNN